MADVDVTTQGIWERESDRDWNEQLKWERELEERGPLNANEREEEEVRGELGGGVRGGAGGSGNGEFGMGGGSAASQESGSVQGDRRRGSTLNSRESTGPRPVEKRRKLGRGQLLTSGNLKAWTTMVRSLFTIPSGFASPYRARIADFVRLLLLRRTRRPRRIDGELCRRSSRLRFTSSSSTAKLEPESRLSSRLITHMRHRKIGAVGPRLFNYRSRPLPSLSKVDVLEPRVEDLGVTSSTRRTANRMHPLFCRLQLAIKVHLILNLTPNHTLNRLPPLHPPTRLTLNTFIHLSLHPVRRSNPIPMAINLGCPLSLLVATRSRKTLLLHRRRRNLLRHR